MDPKEYTNDLFTVTIQSADTVYVENESVRALSSRNINGVFDILPHHGDCIAVIEEFLTLHKQEGVAKTMQIHKGIIHIEKGNAYIFLDSLTH